MNMHNSLSFSLSVYIHMYTHISENLLQDITDRTNPIVSASSVVESKVETAR